MQRADDNEAVVLERLKVYHRQTEPLVEYYRDAADVPLDRRRAVARSRGGGSRGGDRSGAAAARCADGARPVIVCRSTAELERMREAGRLVGEVLTELAAHVAPGRDDGAISTRWRRSGSVKAGATPAFKGYHGYPATICASINEEVIHGIPSGRRVLNEGDIISIDVGASLDGYFGDSAITLPVGQVSEEAATLLRVTEESLYKAIERVRPGGAGFGHRPRGAAARRGVRVFGGARVRRPRHRPADARGAAGAELRRAGPRAAAGRGHGARDRADGERRASRR